MIIPDNILQDIKQFSTYKLFGSRSMATRPDTENFSTKNLIANSIDKGTDWDFTIPCSLDNLNLLKNLGFKIAEKPDLVYADDTTLAIAEKVYIPRFDIRNPIAYCLDFEDKVHIVLRNDYWLFNSVWDSISPEFYYNCLWKRGPYLRTLDRGEAKRKICLTMNQLFSTAKGMM
jgi:hypothetical protein